MSTRIALFLLNIYRYGISPALHLLLGSGQGCRFSPTCSEYSRQVIRQYGAAKGFWLSFKRITSCHPFSS